MGTVLVVDDHPLMLSGLRILIGSLGLDLHVETCHSAEVGLSKAEKIVDLRLILLDFSLPILSGIPAIQAFKTRYPDIPLIVLSGSEDARTADGVIRAGAIAYVSKTAKPETLLDIVTGALHGKAAKSPPAPDSDLASEMARAKSMTERQMQVLLLLMRGQSNKEIALQLHLAEITVKTHIAALMRAFGASNRTQVVIEAQRQGALPVTELAEQ